MLLHYAEHYLVRRQPAHVIELADLATKHLDHYPKMMGRAQKGVRDDYLELKARLVTLKGQAYHM